MSIGFHIVNEEFLEKLQDYIKVNAKNEKEKFNDVEDRILRATIAYQYLCKKTNKDLSLTEIFEKHQDLGLIGPGHGYLTRMLEKFFNKSETFKKHACLHDVFGNFCVDFDEGPGYCYASPLWLPSWMRNAPLMGHITGLWMCSKTKFTYE